MTKYTIYWHGTIVDNEDGWHIPPDPENRHFQEYLAWRAEGNCPDLDHPLYALDKENSQYVASDMLIMQTPDIVRIVPIP